MYAKVCVCVTQTHKDEGQEASELFGNTRSREVHLRPIIPYSPSIGSKVKQNLENACTTFQKINIYIHYNGILSYEQSQHQITIGSY